MKILILAAGEKESHLNDSGYPFYLTEFEGVPLIERLVQQCESLTNPNFLFAINENEIKRWRLDNVIAQLTPQGQLIRVQEKTAGAACTALLAIEQIESDDELLILNANDTIDANFNDILQHFRQQKLDAGTVVFHSIHPRYSYVALDKNDRVIEAAEKNPISQHATAGFYWFARGKDFVKSALQMIAKEGHVDGNYFICPVMNEMILAQAQIGVYRINNQHYHPLKTIRQLQQFESILETGRHA